ncbi:hypothetical protein [Aquabacterium sp.]|uniref:hypothetical protein n=1 Tax=Aquabacterium sp. TaxID=1872578 RepID=UPI003D6CD03C
MMLHLLKRLGLPGLVGLLVLAGAGWGQAVWLPRQQAEAEAQASRARQLRHELLAADATGAKRAAERVLTPDAAWQSLWSQLPDSSQRTALQSQVLSSARDQGLSLSAVQFKGGPEGPPGLWRQRLTMPVEGRYADVRAWLALLLSEPALSLDAVDLQRTDVMGDAVKARISVSLWWRNGGGAR